MLVVARMSVGPGNDSSEARMRHDIDFLASDQCEGRGVNTAGINLAAQYIANEFQKAGLKPAEADGSYFQPFTMPASKLKAAPILGVHGRKGREFLLKVGCPSRPWGFPPSGDVSAPWVFVGYGTPAPPSRYDDYENIDAAGKIVVILIVVVTAGRRRDAVADEHQGRA